MDPAPGQCRRMCAATRGWTLRAASGDPHDFRVPCMVILRTFALPMRRSNSVNVRSSFGVPWRGNQAGLDPAVTGMLTVGVLLLPAEQKRGHARSGERKRSFLIPWSSQGHHRSWRPTSWTCWRHATAAPDGYLIHRTLTESRNRSSKPLVCETPSWTLQPRQP